ncbi:MAG: (2Fe-2S)-binding protein [Phycisphaerales bacterium]|nr:(2Fe-2S)-binding protein [Phycisphaerales bacterium]
MQTVGLSSAAALADRARAAAVADDTGAPPILGPGAVDIALHVNGATVKVKAEPATTLLEVLRMHLGLTGSKEICGRGACGGCSVLVDGKLVYSCMMLAVDAISAKITTIEGLAEGDALDPIQESFIRHDALQCGYCTPGFVMASTALLGENPRPSLDEIKAGLSGNSCRCGSHSNIFNAVLDASGQAPIHDGEGA